MKNIIIILIVLLTISCSLDRTNPLDPLISGEGYPEEVPNIDVDTIDNHTIIYWSEMQNVDGYYIYRSQSYYGLFKLIKDVEDEGATSFEDLEAIVTNNDDEYWYKMSAYIIINGENLEGYRSDPNIWN